MAKLKYDRPINILRGSDTSVKIPKDEVWKVTVTPGKPDVGGVVLPPSVKLYGGGTNSIQGTPKVSCLASPSSISTSKRNHGGDSPWLKDLSSIGRSVSDFPDNNMLRFRRTKCGKLLFHRVAIQTRLKPLPLQQQHKHGFWEAGAKCLKAPISPASPLRSWRNNDVEGVTLYA